MIIVGGGSLLSHAALHARRAGHPIDLICCPHGDPAIPKLERAGLTILKSDDPSSHLLPVIAREAVRTVFSINNGFILRDELLRSGPEFFNIHNGLVQNYRGISEVCVIAAICDDAERYGVTLHRLEPGQKVDAGPVIAQHHFPIDPEKDGFVAIMTVAMNACRAIFEENLERILSGNAVSYAVELSGAAYSYRNLPLLLRNATPGQMARIRKMGAFASFLPRLASTIERVDAPSDSSQPLQTR